MKTVVVGLSCFLTGAAIAFGSASVAQITREPDTPKEIKPKGGQCGPGFTKEIVTPDGNLYKCYQILDDPSCIGGAQVLVHYGIENGNRLEYYCHENTN